MNAHQRRKGLRARTHYRCDLCHRVRRWNHWGVMIGCLQCHREWQANSAPMPGYPGVMVWRNPRHPNLHANRVPGIY